MLSRLDAGGRTGSFPGVYSGTVHSVRKDGWVEASVPAVFDRTSPDAYALARPCFPAAHFFVPKVGDKVWIAFEGGDPDAAVWLGTWYADGAVPQEADADPPVKRVIRSASGHLVVLDDTPGAEQVILADKSGNRVELRTDGVLIKSTAKLTIDASGQEIEILAGAVNIKKA